VRLSLSGAGGALDAVLYAKPLEISTRSNYAQSTVQPDKLSRRERQLQDLVSKFLVRGGAHSVRFSYGARGNFQAVLLLQPPRHDEKLHNAPATTATVAPAKAASHGKPPVAEAPTSRPASPAVSANVSKTKVDKNALSARSGGAKRAASSSPTDEDAPPTLTKRAAKKPDYDAWQRHCLLLALEYGIDGPQVMDEALSAATATRSCARLTATPTAWATMRWTPTTTCTRTRTTQATSTPAGAELEDALARLQPRSLANAARPRTRRGRCTPARRRRAPGTNSSSTSSLRLSEIPGTDGGRRYVLHPRGWSRLCS